MWACTMTVMWWLGMTLIKKSFLALNKYSPRISMLKFDITTHIPAGNNVAVFNILLFSIQQLGHFAVHTKLYVSQQEQHMYPSPLSWLGMSSFKLSKYLEKGHKF